MKKEERGRKFTTYYWRHQYLKLLVYLVKHLNIPQKDICKYLGLHYSAISQHLHRAFKDNRFKYDSQKSKEFKRIKTTKKEVAK